MIQMKPTKISLLLLSILFSNLCFSQNIKINRFENQIKKFEIDNKFIAPSNDLVVLYGSSSFANWAKSSEMLAPYQIVNRGFGGSTAAEALYYFERVVLPLKPKIIFFYEGDNDIYSGFSVDSVFSNYRKILALVKKKLPETKFIVVSVKYSPSRKHLIETQKKLNHMTYGLSKTNPDLSFIDITPLQLLPNGQFDSAMFEADSLHVSTAAYQKWAVRMKQSLEPLFPKNNKENWVNIFNGKDFEGWEQKGGAAKYEVKDGVIIGTSTQNTPNSFMCTKKIYKDFVLEFEVKVDTNLNSGVQFRSNSRPDYREGVVHGYQCEIDPSPRAFSGGIYDEQRRGWLYKPESDPHARMAFNRLGWNKYRIEVAGYSIKSFINGIPVSDIIDTVEPSGFIGLQVHSIHKPEHEATKVMWKNIRIWER